MTYAAVKQNDLSFVSSIARIAIYDDFLSEPRILEVQPAPTIDFIGELASTIYNEAKSLGGSIPYSVIKQVGENFIHAYFTEMVVSIFNSGNTIRFSDQGPGIQNKDKAQEPGYSSATLDMKRYINGVGSGLPIVREYLDLKHGSIQIEDNLNSGAVITISLFEEKNLGVETPSKKSSDYNIAGQDTGIKDPQNHLVSSPNLNPVDIILASLSKRSISILYLFKDQYLLGVTEIGKAINVANSSVSAELKKLQELGLVSKIGTKRTLTNLGYEVLNSL